MEKSGTLISERSGAMKFSSPAIQEEFLLNASPEFVYNWIRDTACNRESEFKKAFPEGLLIKLRNRHDPLINLAIAEFGDDDGLLKELYEGDNQAIRIAVLSNPFETGFFSKKWMSEDQIREICLGSNEETRAAYFKNRQLKKQQLEAVFLKTGLYAELPDDAWKIVIHYALQNPNVLEENEDPYSSDGWEEYTDSLPRKAAWGLLQTLNNTVANANLLCGAFYKIPFTLPDLPKTETGKGERDFAKDKLQFFSEVLNKWSAKASKDEDAIYRDGEEAFYFRLLREEVAAGALTYDSGLLRFLENHEDVYVRRGYYRIFTPRKATELEGYFSRDGKNFLEAALYNKHLYEAKPHEVRDKFHEIIQYKMKEPGIDFEDAQSIRYRYDTWAKRLSEENPDYYCEDPTVLELEKEEQQYSECADILKQSLQNLHTKVSELSDQISSNEVSISELSKALRLASRM